MPVASGHVLFGDVMPARAFASRHRDEANLVALLVRQPARRPFRGSSPSARQRVAELVDALRAAGELDLRVAFEREVHCVAAETGDGVVQARRETGRRQSSDG